jgi:lia operon protein LiaG
MKKTLILALFGLLASTSALHAQEYKSKLGKDRKVVIDMQGSDVTVEGYDGNELVIRGNGFEPAPKRAEGLRPVYNSAVDNTNIGIAVTEQNNVVRIVRASRKEATYTIRVPHSTAVEYNQTNWNGGDLLLRDVNGDLEINMKNGDVKLLNVAGPVVASSVSGDITVRYGTLRPGPSAISAVSGDIDVTMPGSSKATLQLRSISGEIYTDFDLAMPKDEDEMRHVGGQVVDGTVNGGGTKLALKAVSGDIYVRKAK